MLCCCAVNHTRCSLFLNQCLPMKSFTTFQRFYCKYSHHARLLLARRVWKMRNPIRLQCADMLLHSTMLLTGFYNLTGKPTAQSLWLILTNRNIYPIISYQGEGPSELLLTSSQRTHLASYQSTKATEKEWRGSRQTFRGQNKSKIKLDLPFLLLSNILVVGRENNEGGEIIDAGIVTSES